MNVFISLTCLDGGDDIFDVLDIYRRSGVTNVELGSWTKDVALGQDALIRRLRGYSFKYQVHNYFPPEKGGLIVNLASPDKEVLDSSKKYVKNTLGFCRDIGSDLFTVHAGFCVDPVVGRNYVFRFPDTVPQGTYKRALNIFVDSIGEISSDAKRMGVRLGIENNVIPANNFKAGSYRCLLMCEAAEFEKLWHDLPSDNIGILLDLGHLKVASTSLGFDKDDFVERLRSKTFSIHLHDNDGITDRHLSLTDDSWALGVIKKGEWKDVSVVLEAKHLTIDEIRSQVMMIG